MKRRTDPGDAMRAAFLLALARRTSSAPVTIPTGRVDASEVARVIEGARSRNPTTKRKGVHCDE